VLIEMLMTPSPKTRTTSFLKDISSRSPQNDHEQRRAEIIKKQEKINGRMLVLTLGKSRDHSSINT
jgi:hypothetical protein